MEQSKQNVIIKIIFLRAQSFNMYSLKKKNVLLLVSTKSNWIGWDKQELE